MGIPIDQDVYFYHGNDDPDEAFGSEFDFEIKPDLEGEGGFFGGKSDVHIMVSKPKTQKLTLV